MFKKSTKQKSRKSAINQAAARKPLQMRALEPRVLLDAAAMATAAEAINDQNLPQPDAAVEPHELMEALGKAGPVAEGPAGPAKDDASAAGTAEPDSENIAAHSERDSRPAEGETVKDAVEATAPDRREIYFIDGSVTDIPGLMNSIGPDAEVHVLDVSRDGVEQIAQILQGRTDIDAVHIVSHGGAGVLNLGTAVLDTATMQGEYADELQTIGEALSRDGDLLIYGCDFAQGESGQQAMQLMASITQADVAGSTDATGSADRGGDWDLESRQGEVEAAALHADNWDHVLAPPTLDLDASTSGSNYAATMDQDAVAIGGGIVLTNVDGGDIASVTVTLSNATAQDNLSLSTPVAGITATYNAATGVLTLSGNASAEAYQTALGLVRFATTSGSTTAHTIDVQAITAMGIASNVATATITPIDTDGDGVANAGDLDDDNDGITDFNDGFRTFSYGESPSRVSANEVTGTAGGVGFSLTSNVSIPTASNLYGWSSIPSEYKVPNSNPTVQLYTAGTFTLTFDSSVKNPVLVFTSIGAPGSLEFIDFGVPYEVIWSSGNITVDSGTRISGREGNVIIRLLGEGTTFTFTTSKSDGVGFVVGTSGKDLDTDADGVANRLDIDSDNDGITDNVEAQSTQGYIAPSGQGAAMVDADRDGLDDRYDANTASNSITASRGLAPVDTDGDGTRDYIDSDSDNDGKADIVERGDGQATSVTNTTDTDGDGLLDIFEAGSVSDGYDSNDSNISGTTFNLGDLDNDTAPNPAAATPRTADFDYRDSVTPPLLDLNSDASFTDSARDNTVAARGGDTGVLVATADAGVNDSGDNDITALRITLGGLIDGASEQVSIGGVTFVLNASSTQTMAVGGTTFSIAYTVAGGFVISRSGGGTMPQADLATLVRSMRYANTLATATAGNRTLSFVVQDSSGAISPAALSTIAVTPDQAPQAKNDVLTHTEDGGALPLDLLGNDTDPEGDALSVYSINGVVLTPGAAQSIAVPNGMVHVAVDGSMSFVADPDFNGTVSFDYVIQDNPGHLTSTATVTIDVASVNDAPVNTTPSDQTVAEDTDLSIAGISVHDVDGDLATTQLTVANGTLTLDLSGGATISSGANGSSSITLGGTQEQINAALATLVYRGNANFNGNDTLTVRSTDSGGPALSDTESLIINVTAVSDAPSSNAIADQSGNDSDSVELDVSTNFTDPDFGNGDTLSFAATGLPPGLSIDATTGVISGTIDGSASQAGSYSVSVTATDSTGQVTSQTFSWSVSNRAPTATDDALATSQGTDLAAKNVMDANGGTVDVDPDGDNLAVSAVNGMGENVGTAVAGSNGGTFTISSTGELTFTQGGDFDNLGAGQTRTTSVTYTISDGQGGTSTATVTVTVTGVNDAPVNTVPGAHTVNEDSPLAIDGISVTDIDGDLATTQLSVTNGMLTVDLSGGATISAGSNGGHTLTLSGTQAQINAALATLVYQGDPDFNGSDTLTVLSTDSAGTPLSDSDTIAIMVNAVNDVPVGTADGVAMEEDGHALALSLTANDTDVDGDAITVAQINGIDLTGGAQSIAVDNGTVVIAADGTMSFVPKADFNGTVSFSYVARDPSGATTGMTSVTIVVAPVVDVVNDTVSTNEDAPVSFNVLTGTGGASADSFEGSAQLTAVTQPPASEGSVTFNADGTITFTPAPDFNGITTFTYTVTSGGVSETATVTVNVAAINDAPVNTVPASYDTNEETSLVLSGIQVSDVDAGSDVISVTLSVPAGMGMLTATNAGGVSVNGSGSRTLVLSGTLADINAYLANKASTPVYTPPANSDGQVTLTVLTRDNHASTPLTDSDSVTITVHPMPDDVVLDGLNDGDVDGTDGSFAESALTSGSAPDAAATTRTGSFIMGPAANLVSFSIGDSPTYSLADLHNAATKPLVIVGQYGTLTINGYDEATGVVSYSYTLTRAGDHSAGDVRDAFVITTTDLDGDTTAAGALAFNLIDDAPTAQNDTATARENTVAMTGNVVAGSDTLGADATSTPVSGVAAGTSPAAGNVGTPVAGSYGSLTLNADGSYSYTPDNSNPAVNGLAVGETLTDVFTYQITDADGDVSTATLTLNITGQDDARSTDVVVLPGQPVTGDVTPNDTDSEGNTLTVTELIIDTDGDGVPETFAVPSDGNVTQDIVDAGGNPIGSVTMGPDGVYTFTPDANYHGPVPDIGFTVSDGIGGESSGAVSMVVPDEVTNVVIPPGKSSSGDLTPNPNDVITEIKVDTDGDGVLDTFTVPPGGSVSQDLVDSNGNPIGSITVDANGNYTFTPDEGYTGDVPPILYTVDDGSGNESTGALTMTVPDEAIDVMAPPGKSTSGDLTPNPTDVITQIEVDIDGDGVLDTFTVPPGGSVTTELVDENGNPIGSITVDANGNYTFTPDEGYTGEVPPILYTVDDGSGNESTGSLGLVVPDEVTNVVIPPGKSSSGDLTPNPNDVITEIKVDTDGDGVLDTFTVPPGGSVSQDLVDSNGNPIGSITVDANGNYTFTPDEGYTGDVPPILYTVDDGSGNESTGALTMTVPDEAIDVMAPPGKSTSGDLTPNPTDVITQIEVDIDGDGVLDTFTVPPGGSVTTELVDENGNPIGSITVDANGNYTFTPDEGYTGEVPPILYTVDDGSGNESTGSLGLVVPDEVTNVVIPPGKSSSGDLTPNPNDVITEIKVDTDGDGVLDTFTVPPGGSVSQDLVDSNGNPIGSITVDANGNYTFTPDEGYTGEVPPILYTVDDGSGNESTGALTMTVPDEAIDVMAPPGKSTSGDLTPNPTDVITQIEVDIDGDGVLDTFTVPPGGSVTTELVDENGNPIGSITVDANGNYTFTPDEGYTGEVPPILYTVDDGSGNESTGSLGLVVPDEVTNVVIPPGKSSSGDLTPNPNDVITEIKVDTDGDGVLDTFTVPPGGSVSQDLVDSNGNPIGSITVDANGNYTFTPDEGYTGDVPPILYTVDDGDGKQTVGALTLGVVEQQITLMPEPPSQAQDPITIDQAFYQPQVSSGDEDGDDVGFSHRVRAWFGGSGNANADYATLSPLAKSLYRSKTGLDTVGSVILQAINGLKSLRGIDMHDDATGMGRSVMRADPLDAPLTGVASLALSDGTWLQLQSEGVRVWINVADDGRATPIKNVRATSVDGGQLPAWVRVSAAGQISIDRPADVQQLALRLEIDRADGSHRAYVVDIDLNASQLQLRDENAKSTQKSNSTEAAKPVAAAPFAAQLAQASRGSHTPDAALMDALASLDTSK